jgi:CDP-diacylglycerol--serine O-phosphatidyltransferase
MKGMGKWGWIAAFVYCAGAALRLARFNTNIGVVDKRYFQGLPSPAAPAWWQASSGSSTTSTFRAKMCAGMPSPDAFCRHHHGQYPALLERQGHQSASQRAVHGAPVIVLGYVLVSSYPPGVLFALFLAYALSGYVMAAWNWRSREKARSRVPAKICCAPE